MKEAIRQRARELGFEVCRFTTAHPPDSAPHFEKWLAEGHHGEMAYLQRNAYKRLNPQQVLPGAKTIISVAVSYTESSTPHPVSSNQHPVSRSGLIARYARYHDYHELLSGPLKSLTAFIDQARPGQARSLWYTDTGPILERDLAQRSGLGFVGKHTNLVSRTLGNWILLSEIITTFELEPDEPERNRCGSCTRCLAACPTGAIRAPFALDARRCISYLTIELKGPIPLELRPAIGNRVFGCDDCLAACPWNRFAREGRLMKTASRPELSRLDLPQMLSLNEARFKSLFAGTPILRAKRRGLLRNVCVALGNVSGPETLPALEKTATDPDPIIAAHASWAIEQIVARCNPSAR